MVYKMKIIVDTKEDSREEIEKAAKFLLEIAGHQTTTSEFQPEVTEGAMGMFGDDTPKEDENKPFNINKVMEY